MDNFITDKQFWAGIGILIQNYHAINRKIFACVLHKVFKVNKGIQNLSCADDQHLKDVCLKSTTNDVYETTEDALKAALHAIREADYTNEEEFEGFILFFKFLTKKLRKNVEAVGKIDFINKTYTCSFLSEDLDDYSVQLENGELTCRVLDYKSEQVILDKSKGWIDFVLKPKLLKWCKSTPSTAPDVSESTKQTKSLQLVDLESYNELYKTLKNKYAEKALNCWNTAKETTDPLKFIYEDLAISAYLISLWKRVGGAPKGFADLGCGNGLLVYILSEEGYNGYGYDVRARKIWACYPKTTRLIEQTIEPQQFKLPEDVDWLIGNHSDELSPWIPVLAASSSFHMHYFLLPCCAYELSGAKFQRRNTSTSVYQDFYAYLETLSESCGFVTLKDRLKIPSTKRLALIGSERVHAMEAYDAKREDITKHVEAEREKYGNSSALDIKLRDKNEVVRNCTQIDKTIIDALVLKIFQTLLTTANKIPKKDDGEVVRWQCGRALRMREIIESLDKNELQNIKAECGGIKTLLRNKHEIFEFRGGDYVGIRKPQLHLAVEAREKLQTIKKRKCFFYMHHPDGCPLLDEQCTFIH